MTVMRSRKPSLRLAGYDYSLAGAYFVTIVTKNRACVFGEITAGDLVLNSMGDVIRFYWARVPTVFPFVRLGEYAILPNHLHGILWLLDTHKPHGVDFTGYQVDPSIAKGTKSGSLSAVIQNFKAVTTRAVNKMMKSAGQKLWQAGFYDRIIRNQHELEAITRYIQANVETWVEDNENPARGANR